MAATLALCVVVWRRLLPLGIPGEWVWRYDTFPEPQRLAIAALCFGCAVYLGFSIWRLVRRGRRGAGLVLAALLGTGLLTRVGVIALTPHWAVGAAQVLLSEVATSYYGEASKVDDLRAYVRAYPQAMRALPYHLQTHPPGAVTVMWLLRRATDQFPLFARNVAGMAFYAPPQGVTAVLARALGKPDLTTAEVVGAFWVAVFLAAAGWLTCLAVYALAARLFDEETALLAGLTFGLVPSVLVFMPTLDQAVMLVGALALVALVWAMQRGGGEALLLPGLVVGAGGLVTFGILVLDVVAGLAVVLRRSHIRGPRWVWRALVDVVALALGTALPALALYALTGCDLVAVFRNATAAHHRVVTEWWSRAYSHWVAGNLVDFGVMLGLPVCLLALAAARRAWRGVGEDEATAPALVAAFGLALLVLDLSGATRAEVARIWLFLTPVPVVLGARGLAMEGSARRWVVGLLLACQGLQAMVMEAGARFVTPY